jgi:hypothetical protein
LRAHLSGAAAFQTTFRIRYTGRWLSLSLHQESLAMLASHLESQESRSTTPYPPQRKQFGIMLLRMSNRMWSESFISATPRQPLNSRPNWSDRSNQSTCRSRSWKLRSCLRSGFAGYSRTGTAALLHPRAPFRDVWLVLWFVEGRLEAPDEFPTIIAQFADKNRTISRGIENTGGSGRPKTVKR